LQMQCQASKSLLQKAYDAVVETDAQMQIVGSTLSGDLPLALQTLQTTHLTDLFQKREQNRFEHITSAAAKVEGSFYAESLASSSFEIFYISFDTVCSEKRFLIGLRHASPATLQLQEPVDQTVEVSLNAQEETVHVGEPSVLHDILHEAVPEISPEPHVLEDTPGFSVELNDVHHESQLEFEGAACEVPVAARDVPSSSQDLSPSNHPVAFNPTPGPNLFDQILLDNGSQISVGSANHGVDCTPCKFHLRNSCSHGIHCTFCHFSHPEVPRKRYKPNKQARLLRREDSMFKSIQEAGFSGDESVDPRMLSTDQSER